MNTTPTTIAPVAVPVNVVITYVATSDAENPESNRVRRHLERTAAVREVTTAVTRWYYASMEG